MNYPLILSVYLFILDIRFRIEPIRIAQKQSYTTMTYFFKLYFTTLKCNGNHDSKAIYNC